MTRTEARAYPPVEEQLFEPLLARRGDPRRAGSGRGQLIGAALANSLALLQHCTELARSLERIREQVAEIREI